MQELWMATYDWVTDWEGDWIFEKLYPCLLLKRKMGSGHSTY